MADRREQHQSQDAYYLSDSDIEQYADMSDNERLDGRRSRLRTRRAATPRWALFTTSGQYVSTSPRRAIQELNLGIDISKYSNSQDYSDVTRVLNGDEEIKAHRFVLAEGSDFFKGVFRNECTEAQSGIITLKDDDPRAIKGLIVSFYGLYYDGCDTYSKDAQIMFSPHQTDWNTYAKYLVQLHIVANKYLVTKGSDSVEQPFLYALGQLEASEGCFSGVEKIIKYVYVNHAEAAVGLRRPLALFLALQAKEMKNSGFLLEVKYKQLMLEIPELGFDVLMAVVEHWSELDVLSRYVPTAS